MALVEGPLDVVTDRAADVTEAWVAAASIRPDGEGLTLTTPDRVKVTGGTFSSTIKPGLAHVSLVVAGEEADAFDIVVPDKPAATLAECVRNAEMAGDRDLGELAGILEQIRESVGESAEARAGAETAAVDAAGSAVSAGRDAARAEAAAGEAEGSAEAAGVDAGVASSAAGAAGESASSASSSATRAETAQAHAEEARDDALEGADRVGTAERVLEAEQSAAQSAADAAGDADRAETAANLVGTAAELEQWTSQAVGAAQAATTEAGRASEEADRAAGAAAAEVEKLKGDAPEAFDTLEEIAEELGRNETERAALANTIAGKADRTEVPTTAADVGAATPAYVDSEVGKKADKGHKHASSDITDSASWSNGPSYAGKLVAFGDDGHISMGADPQYNNQLARKLYVDSEVAKKADKDHTHTAAEVGAATPGYVDSRIQLVTSWPASPAPGVLYLMEEE